MYHFVTNGIYRFCEWVTRLAYLNLLWAIFSVVGLIIFGIGPSTIAMYTVTRKWLQGNTDIPVFRTFINVYKQEFWRANFLSWIVLTIMAVFYVDFMIFGWMNQETSVFAFIFMILFLIFTIVFLFLFPVYVHYDVPLMKTFKYAVLIGFTKPLYTICMLAGALGAILISLLHVTIIIFFSGSLFAMIVTAFAMKAFNSIDKGTASEQVLQ